MIRWLLLLAALFVAALSALKVPEDVLAWKAARLQAQGSAPARLQLHAETDLNAGQDGWFTTKVQAVCDTGNGAMLYLGRIGNSTENLQLSVLPNGCQKAQAER